MMTVAVEVAEHPPRANSMLAAWRLGLAAAWWWRSNRREWQ